jgi:sugar phosphate permease
MNRPAAPTPVEIARAADDSADAGATHDTRIRYRVLAAACGLALILYLHRVGFATAATELSKQGLLTQKQVGYLMAAFMLVYGLVEIPVGRYGDRFGVRHMLTLLVVSWSVFTGAVAVAFGLPAGTVWPFAYLMVLRVLFGMAQGGMFPSTSRMLTDWMPMDERGLAQGSLWTCSRVGGAIASPVVVWLFVHMGEGHAAFWTLASVGFVWALVFWPWFRDRPEEMPGVSRAEIERITAGRPADRDGGGHGAFPWRRMLGSRSAWCLCLAYGGLGFAGNFFITMLPTYLQAHRGLSLGAVSWVSSVPLACGIVMCVAGGQLSDVIIRRSGSRRWGRRVVGATGLVVASAALLSTIWVRDTVALAVLLGLAFTGNDLAMGPSWAAASDIGERHAGTLGGAMNMTSALTGAVGALIAGSLMTQGRTELLFVILASSYALGAVFWLGVDVTDTLADEPEAATPH